MLPIIGAVAAALVVIVSVLSGQSKNQFVANFFVTDDTKKGSGKKPLITTFKNKSG